MKVTFFVCSILYIYTNAFRTDQNLSPEIIKSINNFFLNNIIPGFNDQIGFVAIDQKLDPLPGNLVSGSSEKSVNLGVCNAIGRVSYNVRNLKGLSSLALHNLILVSGKTDNVNLTVNFQAHLSLSLIAEIHGDALAKCGLIKLNPGVDGQVVASNIEIQINAEGKVIMNPDRTSELVSIIVDSSNLNWKRLDVDLSGINKIFNPVLDLAVLMIKQQFQKKIEDVIDGQINNAVTKALPIHIPFI
ncbi:hypothetical protein HK099_004282 [Clydaea vesicula]|uniref:Uncharacterized protein n=1 Tax=Clydaea vesicula TaxID=447962 RepID=A0AAD5U9G2_9FUNG|nr:hypothetical protein HK099_004282 [Clydaea vesicula]KAJ3396738.1 hypothetical protein HDU92_002104 [Lobulomyces angularis]